MKKVMAAFLVLGVMMSSTPGMALAAEEIGGDNAESRVTSGEVEIMEEEGDYSYRVLEDETVEITDYIGDEAVLVVPGTLDGHVVTKIASGAFSDCSSLEEVQLPASITSIGWDDFGILFSAFDDCSNLTDIKVDAENQNYASVNGCLYDKELKTLFRVPEGRKSFEIAEGITSIGNSAFLFCSALTEITLPEGVTSIGSNAFCNCINLEKITLPASVTSIGSNAFWSCSSLEKIELPEGITNIESFTFNGCSGLKEVKLPKGLLSIGFSAFTNCGSLKEIQLPASVTEISCLFDGCSNLTDIKVDPENQNYADVDGCLYDKKLETLLRVPEAKQEVEIAESVTSIGMGAFSCCSSLEEIVLPEGLTSIESDAFRNCSGLKEITLPASVTQFNYNGAFGGCSGLENIKVDPNNSSFADVNGCLYDKELKTLLRVPEGKREVELVKGITEIWGRAFLSCSSLKEIELPESITSIGEVAFCCCSGLTDITVPAKVTNLFANAFDYCSNLTAINVDPENQNYAGVDGCLYDKELKTLLRVPEGKREAELVEGVTCIDYSSLYNCSNLTRVKLPEGLTEIRGYAFDYCSSLPGVEVPASVTSIEYTFNGCGEEFLLYVYPDSYALQYAQEQNMKYVILENGAKALVSCKITLSPETFIYDGTAKTPEVTVKDGDAVLVEGTDYTVSYSDNVEVGTAVVTVTGIGTYKGMAKAEFEIVKENTNSFVDVPDDWYKEAVQYVYDHKLMTGKDCIHFAPGENLARAQFAVILHRMNGEPKMDYTARFADVEPNTWYTDAALWANSIGVVTGYTDTGLFGTGDEITREQMATMMYRYANHEKYDTSERADFSKYEDASRVTAFAQDAMHWAVGSGIITGKDNQTRLDPQGYASRAECATIIMRFWQKYREEQ